MRDLMHQIDDEATWFTMELLMPERLLCDEIERMGGVDVTSDVDVTKLAVKFKVPITTMAIRLGALAQKGVKY